jgi:hypothetical protein
MSCDCNTLVVGEAGPQGPQGLGGSNGTNGTNGINAFTTLSASFTQPALNVSVTFSVVENRWIAIGQTIYISNAGFYRVTSLGGSPYSSVTAVLVKTDGVVTPSSVSSGLKVSPSSGATYTEPLSSLTVSGSPGTSNLDGAVTINDSGAAVDFRVESDTQTHVLYTQGSSNQVGIRTNSPGAALDVNGTFKSRSTAEFSVGATVNFTQADADFSVRTQTSTNTLYVKASTNSVGIGTNAPSKLLDVAGAAEMDSLLVNPSGIANNTSPVFQILGTSASIYPITVKATSGPTVNRVGIFNASPSVELDVTGETKISGNLSVDTNVLKVDTTGNFVGINKTTPTVALDVVGAAAVSGASTLNSLTVTNAASVGGALSAGTTFSSAGASTLNSLVVDTTASITGNLSVNTNVLKVNAGSGLVGINQTTPTVALDVVGAAKISTDLTVNDALYVINSSGFVGINKPSPSVELEVNGSVKANDYRIAINPAHSNAKLTKFLYGSGSDTFALGVNSTDDITFTVTGAVVGDFVQVSYSSIPSTTPNLLTLFGYVSSANNVTVVVSNGSATSVASQTYSVNVLVIGATAS